MRFSEGPKPCPGDGRSAAEEQTDEEEDVGVKEEGGATRTDTGEAGCFDPMTRVELVDLCEEEKRLWRAFRQHGDCGGGDDDDYKDVSPRPVHPADSVDVTVDDIARLTGSKTVSLMTLPRTPPSPTTSKWEKTNGGGGGGGSGGGGSSGGGNAIVLQENAAASEFREQRSENGDDKEERLAFNEVRVPSGLCMCASGDIAGKSFASETSKGIRPESRTFGPKSSEPRGMTRERMPKGRAGSVRPSTGRPYGGPMSARDAMAAAVAIVFKFTTNCHIWFD